MHLIVDQEILCRHSKFFLESAVKVSTTDPNIAGNIRDADALVIRFLDIFYGKFYINTGAVGIFEGFAVLGCKFFMMLCKFQPTEESDKPAV